VRSSRFTRRQALKAGLGLGGLAAAPAACRLNPSLCAGAPPAADAGAGLTPAPLLAGIDTVVVVMMENRSFDNFLGGLRTDAGYAAAARVDGLRGDESNPDSGGQPVTVSRVSGTPQINPLHDWISSRLAFDGGLNDGFVRVNVGPLQAEALGYYDRTHLPLLYGLADQYTVCDRWFSSVMGPTWPNRFYLHAATSDGRKTNLPMGLDAPPTVWEQMAARCLAAKNYYAGAVPWYSAAFPSKSFSGDDAMVPEPVDRFFADAESGQLPSFALIDPDFQLNDAHPPHDLALAEAFVGSVYRALAAGPQWPRALLVITFDEHGGFYDHVAPPAVPDADPDFRQLGFRVPALVVGPTVRRGAVVSAAFEHVSILATLRARFGIASLNARMDAAPDLSACIDPALAGPAPTVAASLWLPETVELSASRTLAGALHETSQPEVERLAAAGSVPAHHQDLRPPEERMRAWLRRAQALEAVRVVR
jgi:phospholipase C